MTKLDDLKAGAIQFRAAAHIEDLDTAKSELFLKALPYEVEADLGFASEVFARGAFAAATRAPDRLGLWHEHGGPQVGRGIEAEDRKDGFWFRAKLSRGQAAQDMASMIEDGLLKDASVEFKPMADWLDVSYDQAGKLHLRHRRGHMRGAAVVFEGAYGNSAFVESVRDATADRAREEARAWFQAWRQKQF